MADVEEQLIQKIPQDVNNHDLKLQLSAISTGLNVEINRVKNYPAPHESQQLNFHSFYHTQNFENFVAQQQGIYSVLKNLNNIRDEFKLDFYSDAANIFYKRLQPIMDEFLVKFSKNNQYDGLKYIITNSENKISSMREILNKLQQSHNPEIENLIKVILHLDKEFTVMAEQYPHFFPQQEGSERQLIDTSSWNLHEVLSSIISYCKHALGREQEDDDEQIKPGPGL